MMRESSYSRAQPQLVPQSDHARPHISDTLWFFDPNESSDDKDVKPFIRLFLSGSLPVRGLYQRLVS
jgi:hypothetical protein